MEKIKKAVETQGVKKQQKASPTYTLRATGLNAKKLEELELINKEEKETILNIIKKATEKHIGLELL